MVINKDFDRGGSGMTESSESQSTASDVTVLEAAVGFSDPDLDLLLLLLSTGAKILGNWKPGTEELDSRAPVVTVEGAADLELPSCLCRLYS